MLPDAFDARGICCDLVGDIKDDSPRNGRTGTPDSLRIESASIDFCDGRLPSIRCHEGVTLSGLFFGPVNSPLGFGTLGMLSLSFFLCRIRIVNDPSSIPGFTCAAGTDDAATRRPKATVRNNSFLSLSPPHLALRAHLVVQRRQVRSISQDNGWKIGWV